MFSLGLRENEIMTVDLHEMRVSEAKNWLSARVSRAPKQIREIVVVHGYRGGTAVQNMVRKSFKHPRVSRVVLGLNPGETILILK